MTLVSAKHEGTLDFVGSFKLAGISLTDLLALVTTRLDPLSKYRVAL